MEHLKPWRLPGSDPSDYFNYGFDEYHWAMYVMKQNQMREAITEIKTEDATFKQTLASMGMGGMPSNGTSGTQANAQSQPQQNAAQSSAAPPGMPDFSSMDPMAMAQYLQQAGMDPTQMDFTQFAQMMGGMAAAPTGGAAQQSTGFGGQGQQGGFGGQGQGYGGYGNQAGGNYGGGGQGRGGRNRQRW
jgi:pre-mRNA 3'-end-processing factor FIP1